MPNVCGDTNVIPAMNFHRPQAEQAMNEADRLLDFYRRRLEDALRRGVPST